MFNFDCHSSLYLSACAGVDLMSPTRKGYGDSMLATPQIARHSPPKKNDGIPSGKKKFQLAKYPVRGWQTARFPKLWPALLLSKSKSPNEHIRRRVLEFRYWRVACNLAACWRIDVIKPHKISECDHIDIIDWIVWIVIIYLRVYIDILYILYINMLR